MSENTVGERNRTPFGDQPFGSFSVYTLVAAQNIEVSSGQNNQRDFVGSQMYVNNCSIICIIILYYIIYCAINVNKSSRFNR